MPWAQIIVVDGLAARAALIEGSTSDRIALECGHRGKRRSGNTTTRDDRAGNSAHKCISFHRQTSQWIHQEDCRRDQFIPQRDNMCGVRSFAEYGHISSAPMLMI